MIDELIHKKHALENAYYDKGIEDSKASDYLDYIEGQLSIALHFNKTGKALPCVVTERIEEILSK